MRVLVGDRREPFGGRTRVGERLPCGRHVGALHEQALAVHRENPVVQRHLTKAGAHGALMADHAVQHHLHLHVGEVLVAEAPGPPQRRVVHVEVPVDLADVPGFRQAADARIRVSVLMYQGLFYEDQSGIARPLLIGDRGAIGQTSVNPSIPTGINGIINPLVSNTRSLPTLSSGNTLSPSTSPGNHCPACVSVTQVLVSAAVR